MNIGKMMKYVRTSELISQEKMAFILGIKRSTYKEYELEYSIIPITHLNNFCNYFNISLDYVFSFTKIENYKDSNKLINIKLVALRLKKLRLETKLTQKELSKKLGIDNSTLSNYENGKGIIATPFLYDLCKKYKISAGYLLGKVNSPKFIDY